MLGDNAGRSLVRCEGCWETDTSKYGSKFQEAERDGGGRRGDLSKGEKRREHGVAVRERI